MQFVGYIVCCVCIFPSMTLVTPISLNFCMMVELSLGHVFSPFGGNIFSGHQIQSQEGGLMDRFSPIDFCHLTTTIWKAVSCSITCYMAWHRALSRVDRGMQ